MSVSAPADRRPPGPQADPHPLDAEDDLAAESKELGRLDAATAGLISPEPGNRATATLFRWLPIRSLGPRQRPRILQHLLALDAGDRYLRFGHAASDAQIGRYVDQLDFDRDELFGVFDRRLRIVAMAHLAYQGYDDTPQIGAEFGVSVTARYRGRGIGARLFERASLHARNRGIDRLVVHALSENESMLRLVRRAGASVERDGPDSTAVVRLPHEDLSSLLTEFVEVQAGELDYSFKRHARRVDRLLHGWRDPAPKPEAEREPG